MDGVRQLGEAERDRMWQSTLNRSVWRWMGTAWHYRAAGLQVWSISRPWGSAETIYAQAGERFVEYDDH